MPWYSLSPELSDAIDFKFGFVLTTCLPTVKDQILWRSSCWQCLQRNRSRQLLWFFRPVTVFLESPSSSRCARQVPCQSLQVALHLLRGSVRAVSQNSAQHEHCSACLVTRTRLALTMLNYVVASALSCLLTCNISSSSCCYSLKVSQSCGREIFNPVPFRIRSVSFVSANLDWTTEKHCVFPIVYFGPQHVNAFCTCMIH